MHFKDKYWRLYSNLAGKKECFVCFQSMYTAGHTFSLRSLKISNEFYFIRDLIL